MFDPLICKWTGLEQLAPFLRLYRAGLSSMFDPLICKRTGLELTGPLCEATGQDCPPCPYYSLNRCCSIIYHTDYYISFIVIYVLWMAILYLDLVCLWQYQKRGGGGHPLFNFQYLCALCIFKTPLAHIECLIIYIWMAWVFSGNVLEQPRRLSKCDKMLPQKAFWKTASPFMFRGLRKSWVTWRQNKRIA